MMYQMGVYCRLSKDDGENKVSESIENQMKLIREYVTKSEDLEIADIYIDDGYSGLYFANTKGKFRESLRKIFPGLGVNILKPVIISSVFFHLWVCVILQFWMAWILFITVMKNWHSLRRCLMICIVVIYLRKSEVH